VRRAIWGDRHSPEAKTPNSWGAEWRRRSRALFQSFVVPELAGSAGRQVSADPAVVAQSGCDIPAGSL